MTLLRWCSFGFAALLTGIFSSIAVAQVVPIAVDAKPITAFDLDDKNRTRFGSLEFVGGLVLRSKTKDFGALSGLRIQPNGKMTSVSDTGFWFIGDLLRDDKGRPSGITNAQMAPLLDANGKPFSNKWQADAEGVTFAGDTAYVSTEQDTRIMQYDGETALLTSSSKRVSPFFPEGVFGYNNGLESVATIPGSHPLAGGLLAIRERPQKGSSPNTPIPGFILKDGELMPFTIESIDNFSITDADFSPRGNLLILERRFSMSQGVSVRIRRIASTAIEPQALLQGKMIFEAGRGQQVDNMEGLTVFTGPDGSTRIGLVSDNNHWLLQRTLYLEFVLVE